MLGISSLASAPMQIGTPGGAATSFNRPVNTAPTRADVAPAASVHGRLRGWTISKTSNGVAQARPVSLRH